MGGGLLLVLMTQGTLTDSKEVCVCVSACACLCYNSECLKNKC